MVEESTPDVSSLALTGGPELTAVSCAISTCLSVGYYSSAANTPVTVAEAWDGSSWTLMNSPNVTGAANTSLDAVSCSSRRFCMAVGKYVVSDSGYGINETGAFAEVWNGTSWELAEPVNPAGSSFVSVSCASSNFASQWEPMEAGRTAL